MSQMIINTKDAWVEWGAHLGAGSLDALCAPLPLKDFVTNKSRTEHGKRTLVIEPKIDERDITLTFTIQGTTHEQFLTRKAAFMAMLYNGTVDIKIPLVSDETYHLVYTGKSASSSYSRSGRFCKITAKFNEPNPADRT